MEENITMEEKIHKMQNELYIILFVFSLCVALGMAVITKQQNEISKFQADVSLTLKQVDASLKDLKKKD